MCNERERERKRAVDFSELFLFAGPSSDLKPSKDECQRRPKNNEAMHQHIFQPDAAYSQPQNAPPVFRSWVSNAVVLELATCMEEQRARAFLFHQSHQWELAAQNWAARWNAEEEVLGSFLCSPSMYGVWMVSMISASSRARPAEMLLAARVRAQGKAPRYILRTQATKRTSHAMTRLAGLKAATMMRCVAPAVKPTWQLT